MAAAPIVNFNDITPAQVDALFAGLPPPAGEQALAISILSMYVDLQEREINIFMRVDGKTREEAIALVNGERSPPVGGDDAQNQRLYQQARAELLAAIDQAIPNPAYRLMLERLGRIIRLPGIGLNLSESVLSRAVTILKSYYSRQNAGKRRRNKSKRKSRKTRRRKY